MNVTPIPAFDDNYIWLLHEENSVFAALVDPGDPDPALKELQRRGLTLSAILITHHHWDHAGGIDELKAAYPDCHVYGPQDTRISGITHIVSEGTEVSPPGLNAAYRVMEVPGHTSTHIAYFGEGCLFCGDTLFAGGCGRVFDGTFDDLAASLQRIAKLPPATLVYCAHEYTLANLGFAKLVEPDNDAINKREVTEIQSRSRGEATVPSTIDLELETNPFMRLASPSVTKIAEVHARSKLKSTSEVFFTLRKWKDTEYD